MKQLTILYDHSCPFCCHCSQWLRRQPAFLGLEFVSARSPEVPRRYPGIDWSEEPGELVVIDDKGGVYLGPKAFIICLYALKEYRAWSLLLAKPWLAPLARGFFRIVSDKRSAISSLLFGRRFVDSSEKVPPPCDNGRCELRRQH